MDVGSNQARFFPINTMLLKLSVMVLTHFTAAKTSSGSGPDDHWLKSLMFIQMSYLGMH